ncbi:MAG: hypothetical protein AVDCRST_MAG50-888, partial [uncultured Acidimicrobiales bacterium]
GHRSQHLPSRSRRNPGLRREHGARRRNQHRHHRHHPDGRRSARHRALDGVLEQLGRLQPRRRRRHHHRYARAHRRTGPRRRL